MDLSFPDISAQHLQAFESAGLFRVYRYFELLVKEGQRRLHRSISGQTEQAFARDFSALMLGSQVLGRKEVCLVVDIGGTHTKTGLAVWQNGVVEWLTLFDVDNQRINCPSCQDLPINCFIASLTKLINQELRQTDYTSEQISAIGVIWSNAIECKRLTGEGGIRGISGQITGIASNKSYRKGEFFVQQLKDGFNLSHAFISGFSAQQIKPRVFLVGNDTVFTLKATPGACAGMVASTGANATAVDQDNWIYNTEMGGLFPVPEQLLSDGDRQLIGRHGGKPIVLEDLIAGKWLPSLIEQQLQALAKICPEILADLIEVIDQNDRDTPLLFASDISALLNNQETENIAALAASNKQFPRQIVVDLCKVMAKRAGKLASVMAHLALPDFETGNAQILSLDSTQARLLPGYYENLCQGLSELRGENKKFEVVLQHPQGNITVPMQGLAAALADELAAV